MKNLIEKSFDSNIVRIQKLLENKQSYICIKSGAEFIEAISCYFKNNQINFIIKDAEPFQYLFIPVEQNLSFKLKSHISNSINEFFENKILSSDSPYWLVNNIDSFEDDYYFKGIITTDSLDIESVDSLFDKISNNDLLQFQIRKIYENKINEVYNLDDSCYLNELSELLFSNTSLFKNFDDAKEFVNAIFKFANYDVYAIKRSYMISIPISLILEKLELHNEQDNVENISSLIFNHNAKRQPKTDIPLLLTKIISRKVNEEGVILNPVDSILKSSLPDNSFLFSLTPIHFRDISLVNNFNSWSTDVKTTSLLNSVLTSVIDFKTMIKIKELQNEINKASSLFYKKAPKACAERVVELLKNL